MSLAAPGPSGNARRRDGLAAAVLRGPAAWIPAGSASRHSRRVALLKRVLPAVGIALLLLIAMWPRFAPLWERMRLAWPAIDLRDAGELRMINPRYAGIDRLGRPYVVTAAAGRQVPDRQDLMSLEAPRAVMKVHSDAEIVVTAESGVYQSQAQLLDLFGGVTLVHQNGTRFVTDAARVDAASNTAVGNDPVEGHGPSGDIKAQGFRILDRGDTIIFTGRSDMLLNATKPATTKSAPAGLPDAVAVTAAHVATEARPMLAASHPARAALPRHPATQPQAHAAPRHVPARHQPAKRNR